MSNFDFSPLFRTSVGFDRLARLLDHAYRLDNSGNGYPPYNIEAKNENEYRISMAVAGFAEEELDIVSEQNILKVTGQRKAEPESDDTRLLHRGIATRSFERRFQLADYVQVVGARLENGLLHIDLERQIPEAMKPRTIEIDSTNRLIEVEKEGKEAA